MNRAWQPGAILSLGLLAFACGARDAEDDVTEDALESGPTTVEAFVRFDETTVRRNEGMGAELQQLFEPEERSLSLQGLVVLQDYNQTLARSNFMMDYRHTTMPRVMLGKKAFVLEDMVRYHARHGVLSTTLAGKKIHKDDYVRITYDSLSTPPPDAVSMAEYGHWIRGVSSIDVVYPNPRLQCVSGLVDGRTYFLSSNKGAYPLTYGPATMLKLARCTTNACDVIGSVQTKITPEEHAQGMSIRGAHEKWSVSFEMRSDLQVEHGSRYWRERETSLRLAREAANGHERGQDVDTSTFEEYEFDIFVDSPVALGALPEEPYLNDQFTATRAAINARSAPNATLKWEYKLRGTDLATSKTVEVYCSRWRD